MTCLSEKGIIRLIHVKLGMAKSKYVTAIVHDFYALEETIDHYFCSFMSDVINVLIYNHFDALL